MVQPQVCPDPIQLENLLAGGMPPADTAELENHLEQCDQCMRVLRSFLDRETLLTRLSDTPADALQVPAEMIGPHLAALYQLGLKAADVTAGYSELPSAAAAGPERTQEVFDFLAPPQAPNEIGRLGSYRVLRLVGTGGMGVVFHAEDAQLKRPVALKVMRPALAARPSASQRFLREAQAMAALKDDHVVTIYQVGEDRGLPFLAMELLQGEALDQWLAREPPLNLAERVRIGREIAQGLEAAHAGGLIHRDIKPGNIWLEAPAGRVKILDFGLARADDGTPQLTESGAIVGTPAYMAPEQARGDRVDARSDLFSLGAVLYRLGTGRVPFAGATTMAVLTALALDQPAPVQELNPQIPPELAELIMQLLAKDPAQRPASAQAVVAVLTAIERRLAEGGPPPSSAGAKARGLARPYRWRLPLAIAAAALLLVGGGLLMPQIILKITGKDGRVREIPLHPGDKLEVVEKPQGPPVPPHQPEAPFGTNPFDALDPKNISPADLALAGGSDAVKAKLVAFVGTNQLKDWTSIGPAVASPDGKILAVAGDMGRSQDHYVKLWDMVNGMELRTVTVPGALGANSLRLLAFSQDGKTLAAVAFQKIHYLNAATGKEDRTLPVDLGKGVSRFDFSPDGKVLAFKNPEGEIKLLDLARGQERVLYREDRLGFVAFSPDGKTLLCGRQVQQPQDQPILLDTASGKVLRTLPVRDVRAGAFRPDGKQLALVIGKFDRLQLWDLEKNRALDSFPLALPDPAVTQHIAYAPDGRHVILTNGKVGVYVLRLAKPGPLTETRPTLPLKPFGVVQASGARPASHCTAAIVRAALTETAFHWVICLGWCQCKTTANPSGKSVAWPGSLARP